MIIDRYIVRETGTTLLAVFGVLMVILVSNRLVGYLAEAAAGDVPGDVILTLLLLKTVAFGGLAMPLSLMIAVVIGLGRLYRDSEMTVLAACGVGPLRILLSVVGLALPVAAVLAVMSLYVAPWAAEQKYKMMDEIKARSEVSGIFPGRFNESSRGEIIFFVERLTPNQQEMENVFVQSRQRGRLSLMSADRGYQHVDPRTGDRFLVLTDGYRYEGNPDSPDFRILEYKKLGVLIQPKRVTPGYRKEDARSTSELGASTDPRDQAEWQWRWSLPIATLLLAWVATMLSRTNPRQGRFSRLFGAILLYVTYSNLLGVARNWMERGVSPEALGLWWVHGAMAMVAVAITIHQLGPRWLLSRLRLPRLSSSSREAEPP